MIKRILIWLSVLLVLILVIDLAQSLAGPLVLSGEKLVAIDVPTKEALDRFEQSGLPHYAHLAGPKRQILLSAADENSWAALEAANLSIQVLDDITDEVSYYLVYPPYSGPEPKWGEFGRVLLKNDDSLLLAIGPDQAEELAAQGAEIEALHLEPKPLWPQSGEFAYPTVTAPDPSVELMINQVLSPTVAQYDGGLSGEWPVIISGEAYTIVTRHTDSGEPIQKATQYVGEHMENLGLTVEKHYWDDLTNPNVIGEYLGRKNSDEIYFISAHLDNMPSGPIAYGADDNASGSTAALIAADILSQYECDNTLRFGFWTGEEQGLWGSYYYATKAYAAGDNIAGVLNLDMIAWDAIGNPVINLFAKPSFPETVGLANLFANVVTTYNLDLVPQVINNGMGRSDHVNFWNYGYPAILAIEDFYGGDFNDYYHTTNDRLKEVNLPYFTEFVKTAVGTLAHLGNCQITGFLDGQVFDSASNQPISGGSINIVDSSNILVTTTTTAAGYYTTELSIDTYTVTASAEGFAPSTIASVTVLPKATTTQDFFLDLYLYTYMPMIRQNEVIP